MTTAFRRIQVGLEATRGTGVAADKKLIGTLTMTPEVTFHRPVDERNSLAEFRRAVATAQMTRMRYEADATYAQMADILSMSVKGAISPSTPETLSRLWSFVPNTTSKNVQDAYTFEYGDDTQAWDAAFSIIEDLELTFAMNETLQVRADIIANFAAKTSFTGAISDPALLGGEIVANHCNVWIDGTWANLGTTAQVALVAGGTIRLPTGIKPVKYADGDLEFSAVSENKTHLEMELDLISSSAAITEYDAYVAGTDRAVRLSFIGAIIESAITYQLDIDILGKYVSAPEIWGERDGEDLFRMNLNSHEDSSGNTFAFNLTNQITAI